MKEHNAMAEAQNDWELFLQRLKQRSPWEVLGLDQDADESKIQNAYEERRSQSPPEDIQAIREAYFTLMDPLSREIAAHLVPGIDWDLEEIFRSTPTKKNYLGPRAWYRFITPERADKVSKRRKKGPL
jgi:curved DNA-binding protein CbpA